MAHHLEFGTKTLANVVAIVGPTAVGKTAVAIELTRVIGGEIVSADSMAVYMGMDIGTAKPTREEQSQARFHLIDVADPAKPFSVGDFQKLAQDAIDDVISRNPPAIVVGGSGLYVRAAVDGLDMSIPARDDALRKRLAEEARLEGPEKVHARLAEVDPESARLIHPNNLKRVIRALEIFGATGTPASVLFELDSTRPPRYPGAQFFGLTMSREALYARIEERVGRMIEYGLIEEVSSLLKRGLDPALPSMQGLGYKEMAGYLICRATREPGAAQYAAYGQFTREEAIALIKKNTRRFAKRQYTWFKADPRVVWIDVEKRAAREVSQTIAVALRASPRPRTTRHKGDLT